jgi:hypothetical protein
MKQPFAGVPLQGSPICHTHSPKLPIQHQKNQPMLTTQGSSKRDLPTCSNKSTLSGANPHLITQAAPGSKLQVSSGKVGTSTTTKGRIMKKPQVGIREDVCLCLAEGIMTSTRLSTASTTGLHPLRRPPLPYKVRYTNTPTLTMAGGDGTWDGQSPTATATSEPELGHFVLELQHLATSLSHHDNNQLGERASPMYPAKYFFPFYYFKSLLYI